MFEELEKINSRPKAFEFYTADDLWTDDYTSKQMLSYHLNKDIDLSSRNEAFIEHSADWIASHFDVAGKKIADFGCGPGLYAKRMAKKGADVTGIDFSRNSIEYARDVAAKEDLEINYVQQNYLDFDTDERFDLIIMIMCDFCALSPAQRKTILSSFHKLLDTGGSVLLDAYSLKAFEKREEISNYEINSLNAFWSPNKYYGFLNTFKYDDEKVVLDKYTIIEEKRERIVYNWLQYFNPEELKKEFIDCGFSIEKLYGNVAGDPFDPEADEFAILAKKQN